MRADQLVRALAVLCRHPIAFVEGRSIPWCSMTFDGMRHEMSVRMAAADAAAFCAGIAEAEVPLRGHILADIVAEPQGALVRIAALTIAECAPTPAAIESHEGHEGQKHRGLRPAPLAGRQGTRPRPATLARP